MADKRLVPFEVHSTTGKLTDANEVGVDTSSFNGNLSGSDINVQHMAETIDNLSIDGSNETVAASNVTVSNTNLTGLLRTSQTAQNAFDRIDATGIGAPIFTFTGNYSLQASNISEWFGGRAFQHVQGRVGQTNGRRTLTLAGDTAMNSVFDTLNTAGLPEQFQLTISYLGGLETSSILSNALTITPRVGGRPIAGRSSITLGYGDSVTLEITRTAGVLSSYSVVAEGVVTTTSGNSIDDLEFQNTLWSATEGALLPSAVPKGYAFRIINAPSDGSGRFGVSMHNGDWAVWIGNSFTSWATTSDWFVLPAASARRLTAQGQNFLEAVSEIDNKIDRGFAEDLGASDALVWLTPATFNTGAFLSPSTDPNNPRGSETIPYIGGRENRNQDGQFTFGSNRFNSFLYVGITPSFLTREGASNIDIVIKDNGEEVRRFNLADDFTDISDPTNFPEGTVDTFVYNPIGDANSAGTINYVTFQTIEVVLTEVQRHFRLDADKIDATQNIDNLDKTQLNTATRALLEAQHGISSEDEAKLSGLEISSSSSALPDNYSFLWKIGAPSNDANDYRSSEIQDGLIPDFVNQERTILVDKNVTITGISRTSNLRLAGEFLGKRAYTFTQNGATVDNALDQISTISGTIENIGLSGAATSFKIDENNIEPSLLNEFRHSDYTLPEPLRALNNQADVFRFSNTDFVSKNNHAGIANMWSVLKNEPDGTDGTPSYPISSGDLVNEITNSSVTVTPPTDLSSVYIPRLISGELDNGVAVITDGHMTGAGLVGGNGLTIDLPNDENYRQILGFWLYIPQNYTTNQRLIEIKDTNGTYRPVFGVSNGHLTYNRNNQDGSPATTRTVSHTLYTVDGELTHTFAGTASQEEEWRVYSARTYTFNARLISNGNDEGSTTVDFTVDNLGTDKTQNVTFSFTTASGTHTQAAVLRYVANDSLYGGAGHTLRVEIDQLAHNNNFDIDHILISVTYDTTENVPASDDTYTLVPITQTNLSAGVLHKCIFEFRKNATTDRLEVLFSINGVNYNTIDDFNYDVFRFVWDGFRVNGNTNTIMQNIQGFVLNTDTPLIEFPTHAILRDWLINHDVKVTDYVWDNVKAPSRDVEVVHFVENVNFDNFLLVSSGNKKFRLEVSDEGALSTKEVI